MRALLHAKFPIADHENLYCSYTGYIKVADEINGGGYTTIGYLGFAEGAAAGVFSSLVGPISVSDGKLHMYDTERSCDDLQADAIPIEFPADLATGSGILINSNLMISPTSPLAAQYGSYLGASKLWYLRRAKGLNVPNLTPPPAS
jgi:hypothetical protein